MERDVSGSNLQTYREMFLEATCREMFLEAGGGEEIIHLQIAITGCISVCCQYLCLLSDEIKRGDIRINMCNFFSSSVFISSSFLQVRRNDKKR